MNRPSRLYGASLWRFGLRLAQVMPASLAYQVGKLVGLLYWLCAPKRRAIVHANLLPVCEGDPTKAAQATRKLFGQFSRKLIDLWLYESGRSVDHLFSEWTGWEHFTAAQAGGRGVLLVTVHLGNWEFGGPLLARKGVKLYVVTLAEPGEGFTEIRQQARACWGIETLVVGQDAFAFVEIIKHLQAGHTVALLVDRPPDNNAVEVELFGRPCVAAIGAAELARASGCAVLPVYLPAIPGGYAAHILPELSYDRVTLGNRAARQAFTQELVNAFAPVIKQYPEQWYHFVPIWPVSEKSR